MNIEKARLYTIGRLIGIYREQRRGKTQNSFTQRAFAKDICSVNTLKRLESGEVPRDEEVYIILLDKLGLKFGYYELVDNALIELMKSLYEAIEYYRLEEIISLCERALSLLEKVKDYIYYNELYTLFEATYKYYKDDIEISVSMMKHFNEIYLYMDELYESLYKSMIFARAHIIGIEEPHDYFELLNNLRLFDGQSCTEKLVLAHYYLVSKKYFSMRDVLEDVEKRAIENKNYVRLLDTYIYMVQLYSRIETNRRVEYIDKAERLIEMRELPKIKIIEFYSNVGSVYHLENNYQCALSSFEKMVKYSNNDCYLPFAISMAHCQRKLGLQVSLPYIKEELISKYSRALQIMYNYFKYEDIPSLIKQNVIIKDIAPLLTDKLLIKIFTDEMMYLSESTNSYKNFITFTKIINHEETM